ncbi:SPFH domain-containing protein [Aciduricibacillus chroicocephali]|uniref:SPFH domain-containing protein n=1 Tax=Aciduricibacillus chroicocephali TaxID=3054939 RepID=A0ABY9KYX7_9BACI|nr:SPFH domain-containing protein [Bacillaceae bacterium 44XB]
MNLNSDIIFIGIGIVALLIIVITFVSRYKTVPKDKALIVSGSFLVGNGVHTDTQGNKIKIISGGGTFVIPVFQNAKILSLANSQLEISTGEEIYTGQGVPILADGIAIVKISGEVASIATAAEQLLSKAKEDRDRETSMVLAGHLRAILGGMTVEEIYKDRAAFNQKVMGEASPDLMKMGLEIVSFTLKDIRDNHGYLDSLGKKRIAEVKKEAAVAMADAEKETRIKQAEADQIAKEAEIERETSIAKAEKEQAMKKAAYKKEQDKAQADADNAYKLQNAILQQEIKEKEMNIEITERTKQIELEAKEIERKSNQYEADVKKKADADAYAVEIKADAEKHKALTEAEAFAQKTKLAGEAEAHAIREKGIAQAEAKEKLAQAMNQFGQAAIAEMVISVWPEIIKESAAGLSAIDKITVVDTGNGEGGGGANRVAGYMTDLITTSQAQLEETTGIDVKGIIEDFAGKKNLKPGLSEISDGLQNLKANQVPSSPDEENGNNENI